MEAAIPKEQTYESMAEIRKLNLVSHVAVFYNKVFIFAQSFVKVRRVITQC